MDINELRDRRLKLIADARALTEKAEKEDRDFTSEEEEQYGKIWEDIEVLGKRMERAEKVTAVEGNNGFSTRKVEAAAAGTPSKSAAEPSLEVFRRYLTGGREALSTQEFRDLSATVGTEGGYLIAPEKFVNELIQAVTDRVIIRQLSRVIPLQGAHSLGVPAVDDPMDDAEWTSELTNPTPDDALTFGKRTLTPNPLAKVIKVSEKLLRVSTLPVENIVRDMMAGKIAETEERAFLVGTGTNQPLGVFTASASGISTGRDVSTGNTTTALTFDGLIEAKYFLKSQYQDRAVWLLNRTAIKGIAKIKDNDGQYIWSPSRVTDAPDMILGNRVITSEYVPNTFTAGQYVGLFGDFSNYWIAESQGITTKRLDELFAMTNQIGFIVRQEVDAMPVLEEAFARIKLAAS